MLTADGEGAGGAIVAVVWGTAATPEIGIVADEEGRFRVALPRGRFRLQANRGEGSGRAEVEVADAPVAIEIRLSEGA